MENYLNTYIQWDTSLNEIVKEYLLTSERICDRVNETKNHMLCVNLGTVFTVFSWDFNDKILHTYLIADNSIH